MGAGPWTKAEDATLRAQYAAELQQQGASNIRWDKIATSLPGRSNRDVRKRWLNVLQMPLNKGIWTPAEDDRLRSAVLTYDTRWVAVADAVHTRSADQCSKRWNQHLDPALVHSRWTEEEMALLFKAVALHGSNWSAIQRLHFPRRPSNGIKNQHTIVSRNPDRLQTILGLIKSAPTPCCIPISEQPTDLYSKPQSTSNIMRGANWHGVSAGGSLTTMNESHFDISPDVKSENTSFPKATELYDSPNHENGFLLRASVLEGRHIPALHTTLSSENSSGSVPTLGSLTTGEANNTGPSFNSEHPTDMFIDEDMTTTFSGGNLPDEMNYIGGDRRGSSNEVRLIIRNPSDALTITIMQMLVSANADYQVERSSDRNIELI